MLFLVRTGGLGLVLLTLALPASAQRRSPVDTDAPGTLIDRTAAATIDIAPGQDQDVPGLRTRPAQEIAVSQPDGPHDTDAKSTAVAVPQPVIPTERLSDGRDAAARRTEAPSLERVAARAGASVMPDGRSADARPGAPRMSTPAFADESMLDDGRGEAEASEPGMPAFEDEVEAPTAAPAEARADVPSAGLALSANYPNPFDRRTTIAFVVPEVGYARVSLYDVQGREVAVLFDGAVPGDRPQRVEVDASQLAAGVYVYTLEYGGQRVSRQMHVVR